MSLRDKSYDLGPVVKPRDDKFLSSFYFEIVFMFVVVFRKEKKSSSRRRPGSIAPQAFVLRCDNTFTL